MRITEDEAVRHLQDVIHHCESVFSPYGKPKDAEVEEVYVRLRAALVRLAPSNSEYANRAREVIQEGVIATSWRAELLCAVAKSLKRDFEQQFVSSTFAALVRAEVFDDLLEMGEHLLIAGYKDPAAVVIGAVLEEHLRKLCARHGVSVAENGKPRKADALNAELASKDIYSKLDQKSVTAWQDLRNKAAHGDFASYGDAQVDLMLKGVRDFVSRYPA